VFLLGHLGMDLINASNISSPDTLSSVAFPEGDGGGGEGASSSRALLLFFILFDFCC